jgi:hypothetical protein
LTMNQILLICGGSKKVCFTVGRIHFNLNIQ